MCMIETERLILRKLKESDGNDLVEILTNPMVSRFLAGGKDISEETARRWPSSSKQKWIDNGYGVFGVVEKTTNKVIGYCGFAPFKDGQELLYGYHQDVWGKGYGTEAGKAALDFAKANYDWQKLYGISWPQNSGSIGLLTKLGFKYVGQSEYFEVMMNDYELVL